MAIAVAIPAAAGPTGWAHQAAGFQSNGAVTVKSLAGGAYAGTQNPTGAVAKANQSVATQAPTVIIQATGGGVFNYMTDCFILSTPTYALLGAGKVESGNTFTGVAGVINNSIQPTDAGVNAAASLVLGTLLNVSPPSVGAGSGVSFISCGASTSCLRGSPGVLTSGGTSVITSYIYGFAKAPVTSATKCYP